MPEQSELFGFRDNTPWAKKGVKKIITKERLIEVKKMLDRGDKEAAKKLREIGEALEAFERRISNK
jgi:hypothetical protein